MEKITKIISQTEKGNSVTPALVQESIIFYHKNKSKYFNF